MGPTEGVWTLSAYVLTFASFMLPVSVAHRTLPACADDVCLVWKNCGYLERKGNARAWYSLGRGVLDRDRGDERQGSVIRTTSVCGPWVRHSFLPFVP